MFDEERYFEPAMSPGMFDLNGIKIGVTICDYLLTKYILSDNLYLAEVYY